MKEGVGVSSCEMEGLVGGIAVQPSIPRVAQSFLPVTPITDWMQMQMNIDNPPVQELAVQPANQPTSTLFLDFGGFNEDGKQYVTSLLKCESPEELVQWTENTTGTRDATSQALDAVEARSVGEYVSKTAGSIGTVNYQLQCHEHEISVNQYMSIENKNAIGEIRDDIKTERGNLRAHQRFLADLDKDIKTLQVDFKALQKDVKIIQEDMKSFKNKFEVSKVLGKKKEEIQDSSTMPQDNLKSLEDLTEMMKQEMKIQHLVFQSIIKKVTGKDDDEIEQVWLPESTRSQNVAKHVSVDQPAALGGNEALSFTCCHTVLTFQNAQSMFDHPTREFSSVWRAQFVGED